MTTPLPENLGYVIDCKGAWLRPHARATAIRLIVSGQVGYHNRDLIRTNLHRFLKLGEPLILDIEGADFAPGEAWALLGGFSAECAHQTIPCAAVLDRKTQRPLAHQAAVHIPVFFSVNDAVACLAGRMSSPVDVARVVTLTRRENRSPRETFETAPRTSEGMAPPPQHDPAEHIRKLTIC